MGAHSLLGPSSVTRRIKCPRSYVLEKKAIEKYGASDSIYALEGSAAHKLAELCIVEDKSPAEYIGQLIAVPDKTKLEFKVTEDMAENVALYTNFVKKMAPKHKIESKEILRGIETKISLDEVIPDVFGTCDCDVYNALTKELIIIDFKYGAGIDVEAAENYQLIMYALGVANKIWLTQSDKTRNTLSIYDLIKKINLIIVQPRSFRAENKIKTWEINTQKLFYTVAHIIKPGLVRSKAGDTHLQMGSHCRFCKAIKDCPELHRRVNEIASKRFNPKTITDQDIIESYNLKVIVAQYFTDVELFALDKLISGEMIKGLKLVRGRSSRFWLDEQRTNKLLNLWLENEDKVFIKKLISVAQAEKIIKKEMPGMLKNLSSLIGKSSGAPVLALADDKRPAISVDAAADFESV